MASNEPRVSIIVLSWNNYEVTLECLRSLQKMDYRNREIVLVDQGSVDGSAERLAEAVPGIRLIRNGQNLGYAGGCNVGIRDALARGAEYVLLLNNDTVVSPDFLSQLMRVAQSDPKIGVLNPKIYFFDPPDRLNYAGGSYSFWRLFPKTRGLRQKDTGQFDQVQEVSFLTGCAMLIKAEVLFRIGLFEEAYFHFYEDIEWSQRATRAGFKGMYVPQATVWHKEHYDTNKGQRNGFIEFYLARNHILFARKHLPFYDWPLKISWVGAWMIYRTLVFACRGDWKKVSSLYQGFWAGCISPLRQENLRV